MDLERLFRQIVVNLAAKDPAGLHRPLTLAEIRDSIVPYRANRRALQIESSEEYELALIRLCAGEAALARIEPAELQAQFASEVSSPNPDLSVIHRHEQAILRLHPDPVAKVLDPKPDLRFAPRPSPVPPSPKVPRKLTRGRADASPAEQDRHSCSRCGETLPLARVVNFCPHCGLNLTRRQCPQCDTELEQQWRHCISCGIQVITR